MQILCKAIFYGAIKNNFGIIVDQGRITRDFVEFCYERKGIMGQLKQYLNQHKYSTRIGSAMVYAVASAIALNFFWTPGHIYSSGFTGLAQLLNTLIQKIFNVSIPVGAWLVILNLPLFLLAYRKIGKRFAFFTGLAILLAALAMNWIKQPVHLWTEDPLAMAIFGGAINGFGTGFALRNGLSTGGLDIIGILIRRKTGAKMGAVNLTFNFFILVASGLIFGVQYALFTGIGLVVNARVIDLVYTRQQKMQVMIVTENPEQVITEIQDELHRGITIVHHAEGGYNHHNKEILFTVISMYEQFELHEAIFKADPTAWASLWRVDRIFGGFYEPKL